MGGGYEKFETEGKGATLTVTACVSNGASRYAMPTIPDLIYAALLYKDDNPPATPLSTNFVQGTKAADSEKLIFSFQKPEDTSGTFTLEVFAFVKADVVTEGGMPNFSRSGALLSGSKDKLVIEGDEIKVTDPIALSSIEPGTVNLKIKVPDGCSLEIDDTAKTNFNCEKESETSTTYIVSASEISTGAYPVKFIVKKSGVIVHILTENINVINGLCTNTWSGLEKGKAKEITQNMISNTVYVRGENAPWYTSNAPSATASDEENTGTYVAPFATIQKAVDKIIAINDGTSEYTIYIDGTFTATSSDALTDFNDVSRTLSVKIVGLSASEKAVLDGSNTARGIYVGVGGKRDLNLTLENLVITDGNTTASGGGIYFNATKLSMTGCTVSGCNANIGGGVFVSNGMFTMDGGTISDCAATQKGGGVYIGASGMFKMNKGEISNCTATDQGGGVYIVSSGTFEMSGTAKITGCKTSSTIVGTKGCGICNEGTLAITGGTISSCNLAAYGGGIYSAGTLDITDGTINDCTAKYGGGIYNSRGTLTIESGTTISSCESTFMGGGIFNNGVSALATITDCTIESCKSTSTSSGDGGGGICNSGGTLTVTGGKISECTAEKGYGGGIYLVSSTATEAPQCTITGVEFSKCKAMYGGGVYVASGNKFRMSGATITGCEANLRGGGVKNTSEDAEMTGCIIKSCKTTESDSNKSYGGGGIFNDGKSLIVTGGEISENHASCGGGVLNYYVTTAEKAITLTNVKISNNTADNYGGGVYNSSTLTLNGGTTVSENEAKQGGGVYDMYVLILNGVTVSQNTATESGGDVYAQNRGLSYSLGRLNLSGTTFVGDIYLDGTPRHITAHPDLACVSGKSVCATITLLEGRYVAGTKVLQAADGETITQDLCDKFALADPDWKIMPDGTDENGVLTTMTFYVRGSGEGWYTDNGHGDITGSDDNLGSRLSPFATIQKAIGTIIAQNNGTDEYTVYLDGTVTGAVANGMADFSALDQDLKLTIKALSETAKATLDAGGTSRVIYTAPPPQVAHSILRLKTSSLQMEKLMKKGAVFMLAIPLQSS